MRAITNTAPLLLVTPLLAAPVSAQEYGFQLDPAASHADVSAGFNLDLPSSLIGDWDPTTNPTGTQTRPGIFGGAGNVAVPIDIGLDGSLAFLGAPTGTFDVEVDLLGFTATVRELDLDLLGGQIVPADLTLSLHYPTFRTFMPDSLYFGGIPLGIPLGSQSLSQVSVLQTAPDAPGVLLPTGNPGEYSLTALVPVEISFLVDFQGQQTPVGPLPAALPLVGDFTVNGFDATVQIAIDLRAAQTLVDPLPGFAIDDVPIDLPTILPPGQTAHMLLDAAIGTVDVGFDFVTQVVASGSWNGHIDEYCPSNPNSTGSAAQLQIVGSARIADNDLVLNASGLPQNQFGLFFMSTNRANVPLFGGSDGVLCVGPPQVRFADDVMNSGLQGRATLALDLNDLPQQTVFLPGDIWNFQYWYRDSNPASTSNTTNAVEVAFVQ